MADYPPYPSQPSYGADPQRAPRGPRPRPVDLAVKLIWAGIALGLIGAVLTFATLDSVVDRALEDAGVTGTVEAEAARAVATASAVVGVLVSVAINAVLAVFIGKGHNWARIVYTVLAGLGLLFLLLGVLSGTPQPVATQLLGVVQVLLTVAVVVLLWRRESSAWFSAGR